MKQPTKDDYELIARHFDLGCTNCAKIVKIIYHFKRGNKELRKIGLRYSWLCPKCFGELIQHKVKPEKVEFT